MRKSQIVIGGILAAATLIMSAPLAMADIAAYRKCARAVEVSCGFPNPVDIDAYQECVTINVPLNCDWLLDN